MQQTSLIGVLLARHVSDDFAHHQECRPVLQPVVFCTQFFCVAVRLSRKVAAWSVFMVWRALLELCPCRAAIQECCCVVRVYVVAGTARAVPLPCGYPGRLLRGPCVWCGGHCRTPQAVIQVYAPDDGRNRP
jgi:hypothetical protein